MDRLTNLFSWGDLPESEYRQKRSETEAEMAAIVRDMPDDKLVPFDAHRALAASLPDAIAAASPERLPELIRMLVERVETTG